MRSLDAVGSPESPFTGKWHGDSHFSHSHTSIQDTLANQATAEARTTSRVTIGVTAATDAPASCDTLPRW